MLPSLVFTVTLTLAYALMQGNEGTDYRHRAQVAMFFHPDEADPAERA